MVLMFCLLLGGIWYLVLQVENDVMARCDSLAQEIKEVVAAASS